IPATPTLRKLRQEDPKLEAILENIVRLPKMQFKLKIDMEQRCQSLFQYAIFLILISKILKCDGQLGN
ncbi:hypothetical protein ACQP3J_31465, partial [Escherichia coli]